MKQRISRSHLLFALIGGAALLVAACDDDEKSVNVLGLWGDDELVKFEAMVEPWDGTMDFTGTRDITAILTTRVEGNDPPDVAIPAEIGLFQRFARDGELVPLSACGIEDDIRDNYPQAFINLGTVDGVLYGFFMKADTKGTIFYNPKVFSAGGYSPLDASNSFDDLIALSRTMVTDSVTPWSHGEEAGGDTGFPGSDWLQQIILNEAGIEVYEGLIDGSVAWTDPSVKAA